MATVECGAEITQDTKLDGDLTCSSGPALVIAADNVTLDLGGHTVSGEAGSESGPGILLRGVSGCRVRNGTVQHFGAGVVISGGSGNVVDHVTAQDNIGSDAGDFGDGILVSKSSDNKIRHNTVQRNGPFSGISLVEECHGNEVRNNAVTDNNMSQVADPVAGRQDMGIRIEGPAANHNKVLYNTVTGSGGNGIVVLPTCTSMDSCAGTPPNEQNEIAHNHSNNNGTSGKGDGIKLFMVANPVPPTKNTITKNVANNNASNGIGVDQGCTENRITGNRARGNKEFDAFDGNTQPPCGSNVWDGNHFGLVSQPCTRAPVATAASGLQAEPAT
jgi:parallel beta-helix repeat protein